MTTKNSNNQHLHAVRKQQAKDIYNQSGNTINNYSTFIVATSNTDVAEILSLFLCIILILRYRERYGY